MPNLKFNCGIKSAGKVLQCGTVTGSFHQWWLFGALGVTCFLQSGAKGYSNVFRYLQGLVNNSQRGTKTASEKKYKNKMNFSQPVMKLL